MSVRTLIVDGYNVIHSASPYRELAERDDLAAARTALLGDVAAYAAGEWRASVVFDGASNVLSTGEPHEMLGVTVIFSPHGASADSVVERLAREARERGDTVEVVTSDAETQWAVMGGAVMRRSSAEFVSEMRREDDERVDDAGRRPGRVTIEERIAEDVRGTLERWARGEV